MNHVIRIAHLLNVTEDTLHILLYIKIGQKIVNNERIREQKLQDVFQVL